MGWLVDDGHPHGYDHEGFVVMVVKSPDDWHWREMSYPERTVPAGVEIRIQVGCECGWRSHRMVPPLGAEWIPCCVNMSDDDHELLAAIWRAEHRDRLPHCTSYRCPTSHPTGGLVSRG
jgi:hypothetical protein